MSRTLAVLVVLLLLRVVPAAAQTHLIVISGIAGDPAFATELHVWAMGLIEAARERFGVPSSEIVYLAESPDRAPAHIRGRSTKEMVEQTFRELAARASSDAQLIVVLFGHGSFRNGESRFNLPGPDMTAQDFAALLDLFPTQRIGFVNTASASGEFVAALSGEGRTIVTATKSGFERNRTLFGMFFSEAFAKGTADVDKDDRISLLEAFQYARSQVARMYEQQNRLLTEHAVLDDNGDGQGTTEPGPDGADGMLAKVLYLAASGADTPRAGDPALGALYRERDVLERQVAELRTRKDAMAQDAYERKLEELLVALARASRRIRELEGSVVTP